MPSPAVSLSRCQVRKVGAVESSVSREERVGGDEGVSTDQEVGDDSFPRSTGLSIALPAAAGLEGYVGRGRRQLHVD